MTTYTQYFPIASFFEEPALEIPKEEVEVKPGDAFNADVHEAITQIPAPNDSLKGKIVDLIEKGYFPPNAKILMIHTGGLQGIKGMNFALKNKNKETIVYDEN